MLPKDVVVVEFTYFYPNIKHCNNIIRNYGEPYSTFENNTGILFSLEEVCFFFYLETDQFLPIIRDKSRKSA